MRTASEAATMYRARLKAGIISIVVGASVCSIKFAGFFATDSYAILSDALESIINVVAASFAAYTIVQSSRKADHEHPYGRGRLEYFSAGIEGSLILLAGVLILRESVPRLFTGHQVSRMDLGLLFTGVGTVANALLAVYLGRVGRKNHSAALEADGKHVMSDVVSSVGLFLGLLLVALTDYPWMDPLVASIMALWILFTGFQLIRHSYHQLMDRASPEVIQAVTKALSDARIPEMIRPASTSSARIGILRSGRLSSHCAALFHCQAAPRSRRTHPSSSDGIDGQACGPAPSQRCLLTLRL
jgi:cation diffusion facilitator family transporter